MCPGRVICRSIPTDLRFGFHRCDEFPRFLLRDYGAKVALPLWWDLLLNHFIYMLGVPSLFVELHYHPPRPFPLEPCLGWLDPEEFGFLWSVDFPLPFGSGLLFPFWLGKACP